MPGVYINTVGLISLASRSEEERRAIARAGGLKSGEKRLQKAVERERLYFFLSAFSVCDWMEEKYHTQDIYSLMEELPIKERRKIQTQINRIERQYRRFEALERKYKEKVPPLSQACSTIQEDRGEGSKKTYCDI